MAGCYGIVVGGLRMSHAVCGMDLHQTVFVAQLFIFLLQKPLLFPFCPRLERGLGGVKKLPSGCRDGLQEAPTLAGGSSKATGLRDS